MALETWRNLLMSLPTFLLEDPGLKHENSLCPSFMKNGTRNSDKFVNEFAHLPPGEPGKSAFYEHEQKAVK
jgi:hypothetical protein